MDLRTRIRWMGILCSFFCLWSGQQLWADETGTVSFPIVNGAPATADQIFGTVGIYNTQAGQLDCTGILISSRLVLTAAHCVRIMNPDFSFGPIIDDDMIKVMAGSLDAEADPPPGLYKVAMILPHMDFPSDYLPVDETGLGHQDDIAVIVLEENVTEVKAVPIASPSQVNDSLKDDQILTIAGYGIFQLDTEESGILHIAEVTFQKKTKWEFFAGDFGASDACMGDSGGPVYLFIEGKPILIGVTSRGRLDSEAPCGDGGIYTLVSAYVDWIDRTAEDDWQPPSDATTPSGSETTAPDEPPPPSDETDEKAEAGEPISEDESVLDNVLVPNTGVRPPSPTKEDGAIHTSGCTQQPGTAPVDALLFMLALCLWGQRRSRSERMG